MADLLRISMFTLARWETRAHMQQRGMDTLLRLFLQSAEARRILGVRGEIAVEGSGSAEQLMTAPAS